MTDSTENGLCVNCGLVRTMRKTVRHVIDSVAAACPWRAIPEITFYTIGLVILFYFVDVLFMKWQGLTLF